MAITSEALFEIADKLREEMQGEILYSVETMEVPTWDPKFMFRPSQIVYGVSVRLEELVEFMPHRNFANFKVISSTKDGLSFTLVPGSIFRLMNNDRDDLGTYYLTHEGWERCQDSAEVTARDEQMRNHYEGKS